MRLKITHEYGEMKLGNKMIPGVFNGLAINGKVRISEKEMPGVSGKMKQADGYEDLTMTLTIILNNDESSSPYDKLAELVGMFRKMDRTAKPEVYNVVNQMTAAWGLDQILFEELKTTDPPEGDLVHATLEFVEWQSPLVAIESRSVKGPVIDRTSTIPTVNEPNLDSWQTAPDEGERKESTTVPDDE